MLNACCCIFDLEETWETAKKVLLGDIQFLQKLIDYDVKHVP